MDFKFEILKSCQPKEEAQANPDEIGRCSSIFIDDGNFLENVDDDLLYVDDLIEAGMSSFQVKTEAFVEAPKCFDDSPLHLSAQINLPIQNIDSLIYREVFMISRDTVQNKEIEKLIPNHVEIDEVGSCCVMSERLEDENILVYASMRFLQDKKQVSQEFLSVVDSNLKLIHEKRVERLSYCERLSEKLLHVIPSSHGFQMFKTCTKNNVTKKFKSDVDWTQEGDFLSFGANILMTRLLVSKNFVGCIQAYTIDIEGEVYLSQHWFHPPETTMLLGQRIEVQCVDRLTFAAFGQIHKQSSFFLSSGYLLKEKSSFNAFSIHLNPFTTHLPQQKCLGCLHTNWEDDIQLMSMYLEFKSKRKDELKQQLEHPRIKSILRDYILCLVSSKPSSVMNFTLDFVKKLERSDNAQKLYETAKRRYQQK